MSSQFVPLLSQFVPLLDVSSHVQLALHLDRYTNTRYVALTLLLPHGGLLPPATYESALKGAVVQVKAVLSHQFFAGPKTDDSLADIREIKIVKRAPALPVSPS